MTPLDDLFSTDESRAEAHLEKVVTLNPADISDFPNHPFKVMLDNRYALLFIRGERPVMDEKYDILKHPNIALTEDGGAAPYEHGGTENAVATLSFAGAAAETLFEFNEPIPDYELLSDEDIEALF